MKRHELYLLAAGATVLFGCANSSSDLAVVEQAVQERARTELLDFGWVTEAVCVRADGSDRRYECEARTEDGETYSYSAIKGEENRVVVESLGEDDDVPRLGRPGEGLGP